ncbi:HD domain-containing protein [Mycolicibacterium brumae]|uniref:HD domain-containing protein n=1 Tax=Mycolicibacterium brumae TaxID=85968 RepID=UPI0019310560|nr:metal-dependent phosphohydrolase [Mycolicibacterium brumae]UWW07116.1 metal-dependent phosphohydrolase [Mycolicibacterium brumae]
MVDLEQAWRELATRVGATGDAALATGRGLLAAWSDPSRRYHSVAHLQDVLEKVDELAADAEDPDTVRLAAWYHDAVYNGSPDDEELSAVKAERELTELGLPPALVSEVGRLIRMTVHHDPPPEDRNGAVLSDADLSALAVDPDTYRANSEAIRQEYLHIPERAFMATRAVMVETMLAARSLFYTVSGRRRWEERARQNLAAELARLRTGEQPRRPREEPEGPDAGA